MFRSIVLLVGGLALLCAASLPAEEAVLSQEYGSGVHSYFAGNYVKAYEYLTTAIDGGTKDPRAFYFRGLACMNLGRPQDAALDFRAGSALEAKDVNRFYNVGKSLERVQGSARAQLETYRVDARLKAAKQEEDERQGRYEALKRQDETVLRDQAGTAPDTIPSAGGGEEGSDTNPFDTPGNTLPKPKKAPKAAKPAKGGANEINPFDSGDEEPAAPETKPAKSSKSEKKGSKIGKKPAEKDDPFGPSTTDKPAAKKPGDTPEKPGDKADAGKKDSKDNKDGKKDGKKDAKKKGGLFGSIGKAIGKAVGGDKNKKTPDDKDKDKDKDKKKPDDSGDKKPEKKPDSNKDPFGS